MLKNIYSLPPVRIVFSQIDFDRITISDHTVRLLNSMKSQPGKSTKHQQSPFHLPPLDNRESEEIVREK